MASKENDNGMLKGSHTEVDIISNENDETNLVQEPPRSKLFGRSNSVSVQQHGNEEPCRNFLHRLKTNSLTLREFFAEFLGTFVLTLCGDAMIAVLTLGNAEAIGLAVGPIGWGFSVSLGIYLAGEVTGAHLNPAVTVAMASIGKLPWKKVFHFMLAQYLGAFIGSAVLFGVYKDAISNYDGGTRVVYPKDKATSHIFACYPQTHVSTVTCFFDQIVGTGLLLMLIIAVTDNRNMKVTQGSQPMAIGFVVACVIMAFGYNCQAPLNPARDLGPRIFTSIAGYGIEVFSFRNYNWFWVPIVGPHLGGLLGVWIYKLMIDIHWPSQHLRSSDILYRGSRRNSHIGSISNASALAVKQGPTFQYNEGMIN